VQAGRLLPETTHPAVYCVFSSSSLPTAAVPDKRSDFSAASATRAGGLPEELHSFARAPNRSSQAARRHSDRSCYLVHTQQDVSLADTCKRTKHSSKRRSGMGRVKKRSCVGLW